MNLNAFSLFLGDAHMDPAALGRFSDLFWRAPPPIIFIFF